LNINIQNIYPKSDMTFWLEHNRQNDLSDCLVWRFNDNVTVFIFRHIKNQIQAIFVRLLYYLVFHKTL